MLLKQLILGTVASIFLVGIAATADANSVFSGTDKIWSADTDGCIGPLCFLNIGSHPDEAPSAAIQQALPSAVSHFVNGADGGVVSNVVTSTGTFTSQQLNFNEPNGTDTIGAFLGTDVGGFTRSNCNVAPCSTDTLSTSGYKHVTLFEFIFTLGSGGTLSVTHDDGASLFADGNTVTDLFPVADSAPTTAESSSAVIGPGTYDLWYTEANGLPAELVVNFTPSIPVPEPVSMALLGSSLVALGVMRRRRRPTAADNI